MTGVRAKRRLWKRLAITGGVAAAAAIAFLVVSQINLLRQLDESFAALQHMQEIGEFVTSPDVEMVSLWGTKAAPGVHAKLAYERRTGRVMLFSALLPRPPRGKTYQLWAVSDRIRPAGVFSPERFGSRTVVTDPEVAETPGSRVFVVTIEPTGGGEEPTGETILSSAPLDR